MSDSDSPPLSSSSIDSSVTPQDELEYVLDAIFDDPPPTRMEEELTLAFESGTLKKHSGSSFERHFTDFVRRIFADAEERRTYTRQRWREKNVTALHFAARLGLPRLCQALVLEFGYNVDVQGLKSRCTPLHLATLRNQFSTVETLIDLGANVDSANGTFQGTPLHMAVTRGYEEIVRLLISEGANTEAICIFGTPLQCAAGASQQGTLKILLDNNVNVNAVSRNCCLTALHMSVKGNSIECLKLLLGARAEANTIACATTPLCDAASLWSTDMVFFLLIGGADPNMVDMYGLTPLENAIRAFKDESAKMLLPLTRTFAECNLTQIRGWLNSSNYKIERRNRKEQVFRFVKAMGNQALREHKYCNAVNFYNAAIYANPSDATLYLLRSLSYAGLLDGQRALCDAQQCIRLRPNWAKAYEREAAAWELMKDYRKGLRALSIAWMLQPGNVDIEMKMGYIREEMDWNED